jgi:hypothetical protein
LANNAGFDRWLNLQALAAQLFVNADYMAVLDIKERKLTVNKRVLVM